MYGDVLVDLLMLFPKTSTSSIVIITPSNPSSAGSK